MHWVCAEPNQHETQKKEKDCLLSQMPVESSMNVDFPFTSNESTRFTDHHFSSLTIVGKFQVFGIKVVNINVDILWIETNTSDDNAFNPNLEIGDW